MGYARHSEEFCLRYALIMEGDIAQTRGTVTRLLAEARAGVADADDRLFSYVDADLRRLAQSMLNQSRCPPGVLGGTELVNLAVLRLMDREVLSAEDRAQFFFLLGRAMRDALADEARRSLAHKRGGGRIRVPLVDFTVDDERLVVDPQELSDALEELAQQDPEASQVLQLRFYAGLTLDQVVQSTGRPLSAVRRSWEYARAWLIRRLSAPLNSPRS